MRGCWCGDSREQDSLAVKSLAFHGVREDFTSTVLSWALHTGQVVTQLAWEVQHVWGDEAGAEKGSPQLTVLGGTGPIQTLQGEACHQGPRLPSQGQ